jgi:hypothetical protein
MELIIVLMQAANNMLQFPEGISTCALFISWFCYVRNVEVEKEISNERYRREKSYRDCCMRACVRARARVCVCCTGWIVRMFHRVISERVAQNISIHLEDCV